MSIESDPSRCEFSWLWEEANVVGQRGFVRRRIVGRLQTSSAVVGRRWTPSSVRTAAIRECPWGWRTSLSSCGRSTSSSIRRTRRGVIATASSSRMVTDPCCSTASCTSPASRCRGAPRPALCRTKAPRPAAHPSSSSSSTPRRRSPSRSA